MSKKIVINTGGGDAPGLNAVIRSVVLSALNRGWGVWGIREGYRGILEPDSFPDGGIIPLTYNSVRGITHLGGTILGTTNRGNPLEYPVQDADGNWQTIDRVDEIKAAFDAHQFDALVAIGGDGSLTIAHQIGHRCGINVIGVPKRLIMISDIRSRPSGLTPPSLLQPNALIGCIPRPNLIIG